MPDEVVSAGCGGAVRARSVYAHICRLACSAALIVTSPTGAAIADHDAAPARTPAGIRMIEAVEFAHGDGPFAVVV
jgi:hypothetical protein